MSDLLAGPADVAAGLAVHGADAIDRSAPASVRAALVAQGVPARLAAKDPTLWGPAAQPAARTGLGWLDTHRRSRELLPQLAELTDELADLDHVVLAGTDGSSLAAEAVTRTLGRPLTVLDTTDPGQVRAALADRLERTVVVVAGTCGAATDSLRRVYWQAFLDAGMTEAEAARHFVMVAGPGSPLAATAAELGVVTIPADPEVSGPYSALTAFALVPAALAGVPVTDLLDDADALAESLGRDRDNPGLALGAALGAAAAGGRDAIALIPDGTGVEGLGDWAAHLLAGSLGSAGAGLPPVVLESPDAPGAGGPDVLTVSYGGALGPGVAPGAGPADVAVNGPLGAHFLTWQYAAAVAAVALGVDPFGRPDLAERDENAERILTAGRPAETPSFTEGAVEVYAPPGAPADLAGLLRWLLDGLGDDGYLAVTAYLDRRGDAAVAGLRAVLAEATRRPVTFGWGPRHRPGQFHRGGRPAGSHLQITGAVGDDLPVPGRPYTLGELQAAQAAGDRQALARRGRPVVRLHLTERAAGVTQLRQVAGRTRT